MTAALAELSVILILPYAFLFHNLAMIPFAPACWGQSVHKGFYPLGFAYLRCLACEEYGVQRSAVDRAWKSTMRLHHFVIAITYFNSFESQDLHVHPRA